MDDYPRKTDQPKNESYDKTHNYSRLHTVMKKKIEETNLVINNIILGVTNGL